MRFLPAQFRNDIGIVILTLLMILPCSAFTEIWQAVENSPKLQSMPGSWVFLPKMQERFLPPFGV
jgi:hypothetical protein